MNLLSLITGRRTVRLLTLAGAMSAALMAGCAHLEQKERELVFRIEPGQARWFGGMPQGVQEFNLPIPGRDEHIHAIWWPAHDAGAPAVLYLHGARWNITGQMFRIEQLREFGFSVLAVDYRGFGKSAGQLPSEQTVYEDARIAWERLAQLQPDAGKRYIYGHSLGGAVAVDLAATLSDAANARDNASQLPANGLIIESSFTTLADMARSLSYGWLPVQLILSQKFDSAEKIARVRMPTLLVHGTNDRYVPAHFSRTLYELATAPKKLLLVEGGSHNNSMRMGSDQYRAALSDLYGLGQGKLSLAR